MEERDGAKAWSAPCSYFEGLSMSGPNPGGLI